MLFQGWLSIALWMGVGLLLEGLLGYKIPSYMQDDTRRELLRLAHTHGTLLGLLMVAATLCARGIGVEIGRAAQSALQVGSVLMPAGFLLAGLWHPEGDPGLAIWLVPPGAVLVIFATLVIALACLKKKG